MVRQPLQPSGLGTLKLFLRKSTCGLSQPCSVAFAMLCAVVPSFAVPSGEPNRPCLLVPWSSCEKTPVRSHNWAQIVIRPISVRLCGGEPQTHARSCGRATEGPGTVVKDFVQEWKCVAMSSPDHLCRCERASFRKGPTQPQEQADVGDFAKI